MNMNYPISLKVELKPETVQLMADIHDLKVVEVKITSPEEYETAAREMQKVKGLGKQVDAARKELTTPLDAAKKSIMDDFKPAVELCEKAEAIIKRAMAQHDTEVQQARIKAEAEAAEKARKEQEKLLAQAQKAADKGNVEKAEALEQVAATVTAAPVQVADTKLSGVSFRMNYSAEVTDLMALVKAVAEGRVPLNAIQADMKFLNNQAKALKENFTNMYAGCKLVAEKSVAAKAM